MREAQVAAPSTPEWDGRLWLELVDGERRGFDVELKRSHLTKRMIRHWTPRFRGATPWILMAPYVGGPLGDELTTRGGQFVDAQGNCHVNIDARYVARVQGKTPPPKVPAQEGVRAAGFRVLYALLANPNVVGESQRKVAAVAGTSKQAVADTFALLRDEQLLWRRGRQHYWTTPKGGPAPMLLERWAHGYRRVLRPKLWVGRFRLPVQGEREVESWVLECLADHCRFGGTAGGVRLGSEYRGRNTLVHLRGDPEQLRQTLRAVPAKDGELIWLREFGGGVVKNTVDPLLVYAELSTDADPRAQESAEEVRERWLPWSMT